MGQVEEPSASAKSARVAWTAVCESIPTSERESSEEEGFP